VSIVTDSQSVLKALTSSKIDNKLVEEVCDLLDTLRLEGQIGLEWVRGHNENEANELADYLAKEGSRLVEQLHTVSPSLPFTMAETKRRLNETNIIRWQERWDSGHGMATAKLFMPKVNDADRKGILSLNNKAITWLTAIITGHGLFASHLSKWTSMSDTCKLCLEDTESPVHLWTDCPALELERRQLGLTEGKKRITEVLDFFESNKITKLVQANVNWLEARAG